MSLHPINLPERAKDLRRIVALQRILLKALCDPVLVPGDIDTSWVQGVWHMLDTEWVRKFCLGGSKSVLVSLREVSKAPSAVRETLLYEFRRQTRVRFLFVSGGDFKRLTDLPGVDAKLGGHVHSFFVRCYELLGHNRRLKWEGYQLSQTRSINRRAYKEAFDLRNRSQVMVCPYCDGSKDSGDFDHYFPKESYPFLACSPWNLVLACRDCNSLDAKGRGMPLTIGTPNPTSNWLHPFFRPASNLVRFDLGGGPHNSNPALWSSDPIEMTRLGNHSELIRGVGQRWERRASSSFECLVLRVQTRMSAGSSIDDAVNQLLEEYLSVRGIEAGSMIQSAVCRAVLDNRPEYRNEFFDSNPPLLA